VKIDKEKFCGDCRFGEWQKKEKESKKEREVGCKGNKN
jgi:hypothetical protein